jgi:hypothetical protein
LHPLYGMPFLYPITLQLIRFFANRFSAAPLIACDPECLDRRQEKKSYRNPASLICCRLMCWLFISSGRRLVPGFGVCPDVAVLECYLR